MKARRNRPSQLTPPGIKLRFDEEHFHQNLQNKQNITEIEIPGNTILLGNQTPSYSNKNNFNYSQRILFSFVQKLQNTFLPYFS